ncbi:hypothetical protein [Pectobacterium polaris]|uniref:hypothetical protein n=1 Tax=Pectobacterium polaris TaxID=2042057 RepID=UPI002B2460A7|nr:hypothetical protein [Pectobacterium polaris]
MAERSIGEEIKDKADYLLSKGVIESYLHKHIFSLIDLGEIKSSEKIVNSILDNFQKNELINKKDPEEKEYFFKKISQLNKDKIILSEENSQLKEQQHMYKSEFDMAIRKFQEKENEVKRLTEENKELKEKTQQSKIDKNISGYVDSVKEKLNIDDRFFIIMSHIWSGCGMLFCIGAISAAFCTFISGIDTLLKNEELNSISIFYLFTRGLLGIGLLSWLSYICFSNSRRYTHESIRRKDRQHALMFGQIFLQIFGGTASKEDAIHVFKDWNMSGDTAFSGKTEQPPSVHGLLTQIKNMLPEKSGKASDSTKKEDDN